jgi:hypothetical protein
MIGEVFGDWSMGNEIKVEFDEKEGILRVDVESYDDVVKKDELTEEFLDNLLKGYREVEESERKKHERNLSGLQRLRETARKNKKEYGLPVKQIHLYPKTVTDLGSEEIRTVVIRSIGAKAEESRITADRWELVEDLAVGADLLIDVSAITTGIYRYVRSGEIKEGFAGFGYLAVVGMALLIIYFVLRIWGEEPNKRKAKYLTHILRTPVTLHRRTRLQADMTFYPDSAEPPRK